MKIMTLDKLEAHDRLLEFKKQADTISQGLEDCIRGRPQEFGNLPFYVFAHARTHDDGYTKRLIWMPRLTKPKSQTNSMLYFISPPDLDKVEIIWMLPARELWPQYTHGKVTQSDIVITSINNFRFKREELDAPHPLQVSEEVCKRVHDEIRRNASSK